MTYPRRPRGWLVAVATITAVVGWARHANADAVDCSGSSSYRTRGDLITDLRVQIDAVIPHDAGSFVEGLFIKQGFVYESQGLNGQSRVKKWTLDQTGHIIYEPHMPAAPAGTRSYFGEGLAYFHDRLYQLTYKADTVFVYNFTTFIETGVLVTIATLPYTGEGWGLSTLHNDLVMSNGDDHIVFRDPYTFAETRRITVHQGTTNIRNINELEVIDGKIYANIWYDERVLVIDPADGAIEHVINVGPILRSHGHIPCTGSNTLNGIAWDPDNRELWLTGKQWPAMFKVTLTYLNGDPLLGVLPDTATTPAPTPAPATPATSEPTSSPTPAPATSEPTPAPTPAPHSQPTTSPSLSDPVTAAPSQLTTAPPLFCDSQLEHQDCCTAHDRTGMRLCMWNEGGGVPFCRMQEDRDPDAEFNVGCLPADVDGDEAPDCYDQDEEARCRALGSCLWDLDNEGLGGDDSQRCRESMCEDLGDPGACRNHTVDGSAICEWDSGRLQCGFGSQPDSPGGSPDGSGSGSGSGQGTPSSNGGEGDGNVDGGNGAQEWPTPTDDLDDGNGDGDGGTTSEPTPAPTPSPTTSEPTLAPTPPPTTSEPTPAPNPALTPSPTTPGVTHAPAGTLPQPEATSVAPMPALGTPSPPPPPPPPPLATTPAGTAVPDATTITRRRHHSTQRRHRSTSPAAGDGSDGGLDGGRDRRTTPGSRTAWLPDETHQGDTMTNAAPQDDTGLSGATMVLSVIALVVLVLFVAIIFVRRREKYTLVGDGNLLSAEYDNYEGGDGDSIYNNPTYLNTHELDGSEEDEEDLVWKTGKKGRFQA